MLNHQEMVYNLKCLNLNKDLHEKQVVLEHLVVTDGLFYQMLPKVQLIKTYYH